jgi:hypothetical protein
VRQLDYEQANAEFTEQIASLEEQLQVIQSNKATLDRFIGFAEFMLADIETAWQKAAPEQRQRVQTLLFNDGLLYSEDRGFLNTSKPSLFTVLEEIGTENGMLASPATLV